MAVISQIEAVHPELVDIRRRIHANPETAFQEVETSQLVAGELRKFGIEVHTNVGRTGVVGVLRNGSSTRRIALRADMDALPMTEMNTFAHHSKNAGRMHACGHDGHTTMLLGAARHLAEHRGFDGTVVFIFQPAEEGGHAGARAMLRDGLLTRFPFDIIFGIHNMPDIPTGQFSIVPGPMMASSSLWDIWVRGRGGHAAQPQLAVDPIVIAAEMIQALQSVVSRRRDPLSPAVLSITQVHAGEAYNVLPDTVQLCGTVRTFDKRTLDQIEADMRRIAEGLPSLYGASGELDFRRGYPAVVNHDKAAAFAAQAVRDAFGNEALVQDPVPTMAGEDFSYYLEEVPGAFIFLGNGMVAHKDRGDGSGSHQLHNPLYDFNDALLPIGASFWTHLVRAYLS
ncbi:M20 aminoacylase family protein [Parapusillimonas granuli]|uniref:Amidohydrolase n=1 Tax=Parapusillimonas granuli TaxID=380911 RepID=A0A853FSN2_9BURK|nr:M20 aminoacylase family protein [Parapusillimonas granuli]MBB5214688.1 hippurate hydrolase [Parapusillimonas granuli]MEB2398064.1 M20 family metallopeptidase [Alcaligenaceae bacterium]NYT48904.1 amidohydrolase [Parapusillimonas granuli]